MCSPYGAIANCGECIVPGAAKPFILYPPAPAHFPDYSIGNGTGEIVSVKNYGNRISQCL